MKDKRNLTPKGAKIVEALEEFRDVLKSDACLEHQLTVRTVEIVLQPHLYTPEDVKRVRKSFGLSQPLFARFLGVEVKTVRSWEQGVRKPSSMACRFLDEIASDPEHWQRRLQQLVSTKGRPDLISPK